MSSPMVPGKMELGLLNLLLVIMILLTLRVCVLSLLNLKGKIYLKMEDFLRRKSDFYLDFILFDYRFLVKDRYEFVINGGKSLVAPSYDMDLSYYVPDRELYKEALLEKLRDVYIEKNRELPKNLLLPLPATRVTSVQVCNTKSNRVIEDFNAHDVLHQALTQREIEYLEPL